jgi:hypothetical protein
MFGQDLVKISIATLGTVRIANFIIAISDGSDSSCGCIRDVRKKDMLEFMWFVLVTCGRCSGSLVEKQKCALCMMKFESF